MFFVALRLGTPRENALYRFMHDKGLQPSDTHGQVKVCIVALAFKTDRSIDRPLLPLWLADACV